MNTRRDFLRTNAGAAFSPGAHFAVCVDGNTRIGDSAYLFERN
ncbi:MAG: hypothetical protein PVJ76_03925 [Gemmatimonadota bacterium]